MHSLIHLDHRGSHSSATLGHTLGSPRLYDLVADVSFLGRRRATFLKLTAAAGVQPGQHVLDVGCGTGYLVRLLAGVVGLAGSAVGVDPSPSMIGYASRKLASITNCHFQVGVAEALQFRAEQFDMVVSSLVIHHLPADLRVASLREMRRVLRPGGKILIAEALSPRRGLGWGTLARVHGFDRMARAVPHLEPLAAQAGFDEIRAGESPPWLRYIVAVKPAADGTPAEPVVRISAQSTLLESSG